MRKLYVTDLDGTLLRNDASLSPFSRKGIIDIISANDAEFTVASARGLSSIKYILGDIPFKLPVIENNGAYITDYETGEHLQINNIDLSICKDIVSRTEKLNLSPYISSTSKIGDKLYYKDILNEGMELLRITKVQQKDPRLTEIQDFNQVLQDDKVIGFTIIAKEKELDPLVKEIKAFYGERLNYSYEEDQYYAGWHWFIINDFSATKARAIDMLKSRFCSDCEKLVVFGDNTNDIPMFNIADIGVAVENAREQLKSMATCITGTNEQDSVVKYIINDIENFKNGVEV